MRPSHTPKPYAQTMLSNYMPKPYTQAIRPNHGITVVLSNYCVQSLHSEMVRLKKECIYNNKSSIKDNYAKLDVTGRFELVV